VKRKALWVSVLGVSLACCIGGAARAATGDDAVALVDGTVLEGHITQQVPGSFVVIQTRDGRVQSVPWSEASATLTSGGGAQSASADVASPSSHQWFTFGLRGTFEITGEAGDR
jgi:hypothetical protein